MDKTYCDLLLYIWFLILFMFPIPVMNRQITIGSKGNFSPFFLFFCKIGLKKKTIPENANKNSQSSVMHL